MLLLGDLSEIREVGLGKQVDLYFHGVVGLADSPFHRRVSQPRWSGVGTVLAFESLLSAGELIGSPGSPVCALAASVVRPP
jgi:hypothetical protein